MGWVIVLALFSGACASEGNGADTSRIQPCRQRQADLYEIAAQSARDVLKTYGEELLRAVDRIVSKDPPSDAVRAYRSVRHAYSNESKRFLEAFSKAEEACPGDA